MEKLKQLAKNIVNHAIDVKENDKVLISAEEMSCVPLIKEILKEIYFNKGIPVVKFTNFEISALLLENMTEENAYFLSQINMADVKKFDCFINIRCSQNDYEEKNVSSNNLKMLGKYLEKSNDIKINKKRWVLLNYPSILDSYKAKMKYSDFYNYAIDIMSYDYKLMNNDIYPLKELMENTDKVRITGLNTDLTFSIKGMPIIPCTGEKNIPDGEIYTSPIKDSVEGYITYNTPSPYQGNVYNNVRLEFKNGKIINCSCSNEKDNSKLQEIFNTDEGARYIGEFSIGINPLIMHPMGDILFDEKIIGSIHFTPGRAYKDSYNGNDSSIHWDMVLIQRNEYGGGNIYFDDKLVRENGIFVLPELKKLNKKD